MTRDSARPRHSLALAFTFAGLLAFPAAGHAAQTFGSLLKQEPAPGPDPCVDTVPGALHAGRLHQPERRG